MRGLVRWALVLALPLALGGCGTPDLLEADDAPSLGLAGDDLAVEILWQARVGPAAEREQRLEPALAGGRLFAAAADGTVSAYAADSGERHWRRRLEHRISGGPGAGDGLVVVGTPKGEVIALEAESGEQRWQARTTSEVLAPPAVGQGAVVVRSNDGRVVAFAADSGARRWLYDRNVPALSLRGHSSPVLVRGGTVVGFDNGRLSALTLREGAPAWEATVGVPRGRTDLERMVDVDVDPVVDGNDLFAASYQGRVVGVALNDGRIAWSRELSVGGGLAVDDSNLYVTDASGRLWAFDRRNGATVWRMDALEGQRLTAPALHQGHVVVAGSDGHLTWVAPEDGRPVVRHRVGGARISAAPRVAGERLYVQDLEGRVQALRLSER
ncbi:outer membrane protein assembly factor BamB [Spiribacter halobius]|uniref:Outer membrane protein assembly factor BamB n=1 Tax=Sediminicurvatus halobius TaxID=2182432 RepID=A0A2U2N4Q0_9GAMM|nr:outer membrane protein assembly factor BamB [Spiribacter halobius]